MDLREVESTYADEEIEHDTKVTLDEAKSDITSLCFLNVLWFERLREYMENTGGMDEYIAEFIEHCKTENRETFNKYKG